MHFILIFIFSFLSIYSFAEDKCLNWFQDSGVKPGQEGCVLECGIIIKDLSTFSCANRCEEFCKFKKCKHDLFWKNKIKNGIPKDWNIPIETVSKWNEQEINQILNILDIMPDLLKDLPIEGIYRLKKSVTIINPASTSENGKNIVIYDRAFDNPFWSLSSVITHELGHVLLTSMSEAVRESYNSEVGWIKKNESYQRNGDFISNRSKDDPTEDFAENFSYFLISRNQLKVKVPKAYAWFEKKYKKSLNIKKGCENEK